MIFSVQRYIEDYLERRGLSDVDQYAVKIANLYVQLRPTASDANLLQAMRGARTVLFRNHADLNRKEFEASLLKALNRNFQKKSLVAEFPGGVRREQELLNRARRRTMRATLESFREAVESRSIDTFWKSRKRGTLARHPERLGQNLLAIFIKGTLTTTKNGVVLREVLSGIGYVDIGVIFATVLHLVELKVLISKFVGPSQLERYMKTEKRRTGWLLVFDARPSGRKTRIPESLSTRNGRISIIVVDINPVPPSQHSRTACL
jgi:hypothetical protein